MKKDKKKSVPDSGKKRISVKEQIEKDFPGYPHYKASEDIFKNDREEKDIDPEDVSHLKAPNANPNQPNEKDFLDDVSGSDLDVPGSELDDELENIGSEDEENNYYSLGGDEQNMLEENKGS